jgi:hypothetical protein
MQVIPEGVVEMVDSIHDELRRPSTAAAETSSFSNESAPAMDAEMSCRFISSLFCHHISPRELTI